MDTRRELETLFEKHGYTDFRWIHPQDIVVSQWVRMKCTFGCAEYGRNASCPPNVPAVSECRQFFGEYDTHVHLCKHHRWGIIRASSGRRSRLGGDSYWLKSLTGGFLDGDIGE